MGQKNKHRFHFPISTGPRYRWVLPDDLRAIKLMAFAQGIINATEQRKMGGQELSQEAIKAGAIESALLIEKQVHAGRAGCNDPVAFRKVFSETCARIWSAVFAYWLEAPEVYSLFVRRPAQQQVANAHLMAERFLDPVERKIAAGEPIEFTW